MAQVLQEFHLQQPASLVEAEQRAGYASWAIRDEKQALIDVGLTRRILTDTESTRLQTQVREKTDSVSFFLDGSYGGTTAVLSFAEANMACKVLTALEELGLTMMTKKPNGGNVLFKLIG